MKVLLKAIITGFGLSVGAAIYKAAAKRLGLEREDDDDKEAEKVTTRDGATDPALSKS